MAREILSIEMDESMEDVARIQVLGAEYFLCTPLPEFRWLIPGLIPLGAPAVLASKGGLGKSFLMLQAAIALATGKPFLDFEPQPPMGAIYFGLEDSRETFQRRFCKIIGLYQEAMEWSDQDAANLQQNFGAPFINWKAPKATSYLPDLMVNLELLLEACKSIRKVRPGIFVIDTLARVSDGDENTVQALRPILNACQQIAEHGWTPLVLHHVGKGQDGARSQVKPALAERMSTEWVRGSSAIVDNFRCVLQLSTIKEEEAEGVGLDPERARSNQYLVFGTTKLNGAQKASWRFLEQDDHGLWHVPGDGQETLAKLRGRKAMAAMTVQLQILGEIYESLMDSVEVDRDKLANKYFPESKNPAGALRQMISKLRNSGLIQRNSLELTIQGVQKCRYLGRGNALGGSSASSD